jgi:hypothetical protein
LRHAAARREGWLGVEDLTDGPNTGFSQMGLKAIQEFSGAF